MTNMEEIKINAPKFYEKLFNQTEYWSVFPNLVTKRILTEEGRLWLEREVSIKEIESALFQMSPDKAPGPDGFNAIFFQKN